LPPDRAAAQGRGRPREGAVARRAGPGHLRCPAEHHGGAVRERLQQVRPYLPGADPGRCAVPLAAPGPRRGVRALRDDARDDPAQVADPDLERGRPGAARALQRLPRGARARQRQARRLLGRGDPRGRGGRRARAARGLHHRLVGPGVPGKAHRPPVGDRLQPRHRHGVPDPRRPLRALAAAFRRGDGGAIRGRGCPVACVYQRAGERHLLPDRPGGADRPRRQERDPDRRVRAAGLPRGQERRRGRAQRRAPALPADRHDLARVRAGRDAAHDRDRRRRRRAPLHGHRRGGRDARRHLHRDDLRAALLRRRRAPQETARAAAMTNQTENQGQTTFPAAPLALAVLAFLMSGCITVGPDYERPVATDLPKEYPVAAGAGEAAPVAEEWWKLYSDATLDELIAAARTNNADMRLAIARVSEAEGLVREANAAYYPEVTGSASASRTRVSNVTIPPPQPGIPVNRPQYQISASTSFELDFWGKFARASESARANLAATQLSRD